MVAGPNPFRETARIHYTLPEATLVTVRVHDVRGSLIHHSRAQQFPAGEHAYTWNGRHDDGRPLPAGVYFVQLTAGGARTGSRLVHVK